MKGISLSSVIQVINLERQSCDIEARADGQLGQLHFRGGTLVDAMAEGLAGEDAAYEILTWENPEFEVNTDDAPRDRMIEADLTQMLLEIARRQDEEKEQAVRSAASGPEPVGGGLPGAEGGPVETPELTLVPPVPPTLESLSAPPSAAPADEPDFSIWEAQTAPASAAAGVVAQPAAAQPAPTPAAEPAAAQPVAGPDAESAPAAPGAIGALNAAGLKRVMQIAQDGIGDALVSADLFSSADGTSYVGVNSRPAACALVNQVTERITWAFDKGGLPPLGRYYMAELEGSRMLLVAPCGGLQLSLVVDTSRVQLGLLLNVVLPEVLGALEEVSPR
jgi:hypothetical protein